MSERIVRRTVPDTRRVLASSMHPLLARVYAARQVSSVEELDYSLKRLQPFELLSGIDAAVTLLADALRDAEKILIVGDFDADGATSCAVAVLGLRLLGARDVDYLVPNRFEFGYGLTPEIVAIAAHRSPRLLVTVDNGISSIEGVAAAREQGMRVLITDHHLPGERLPDAHAIVNPNCAGDSFPSKHLAGVGVMFYVLMALRSRLRDSGWFANPARPEPNLGQLLDLVALGTISDVVPLDHNNRIFVAQGLARIRNGAGHVGISALLRVAGRNPARAVASDLAFAVGPRLNAAGRLTDMSLGIECLLCEREERALEMARQLDELNRERRDIEAGMQAQAMTVVDGLRIDSGGLPFGLCLFEPDWHQGVVGIVAARVKERVHRPVIAFALQDEHTLKGSARSIPGLHVRDALDAIAARHPALISRFGGHAMAAGLTLQRADFEAFACAFDVEVRRTLSEDALHGVIYSDGELGPHELELELAETLRAAGPWGQGFPEPTFDGQFEVVRQRVVGERHLKLSLRAPRTQRHIDAIAFNAAEPGCPVRGDRIHAAFRLDVNEYGGVRSRQLLIERMDGIE